MLSLRFRFSRRFAAAFAALLLSLSLAGTADAEARFVKSAPAPGATVLAAIRNVEVVFSEPVDPRGSSLVVTGPDGARADQGGVRTQHDAPLTLDVGLLAVTLKPGLRPGRYTARWTSLSAVDGHALSGFFEFAVSPLARAVPESGEQVKWVPEVVTLLFAERLEPLGSTVAVVGPDAFGPDAPRADRGDAGLDPRDPEGKTIRVSLRPDLPPGKYVVRWTAVQAGGGETVSDSYAFAALTGSRSPLARADDAAWAALRARMPADAPVFRPTWLPERFRGQPPLPPTPGPYTGVTYRGADGDLLAFTVGPTNGAPPTRSEPVPVVGDDARLLQAEGSPPLQVAWTEQGRPYAVRAETGAAGRSSLTRDDLMRIVVGLAPAGADGAVQEVSPAKSDLFPLGGSGIAGVAVLEATGDQTRISNALLGAPPGSAYSGFVRRGTCARPGAIVFALGATAPAADGPDRLVAKVEAHLAALQDGRHLVWFEGPTGAPLACGQIGGTTVPRQAAALPGAGGLPPAPLLAAGAGLGLLALGRWTRQR